MRSPRLTILAILLASGPLTAGEGPDPGALARRIDQRIGEKLKASGVTPSPRSSDAEFVRRVYLDLAGRIPLPSEVHAFLNDQSPNKRRELVDHLLDGPGYVNRFTDVWRQLLLPEASTNFEVAYLQIGFDAWLRKKLRDNTSWDKLARELINTRINPDPNGQTYYNPIFSDRESPIVYFQAKEGKPENIAAATARAFLGVNIECAQCHDHPFARWSREQFWSTAAFFAGIERNGPPSIYTPLREVLDRREIAIPNTEKVVQAAFLDDKEPRWKFQTSSRQIFAEWMTAKDNPFFARTAVNRMWAQFFGIGIVDPVDDFNDENQPSHPELLDDMAQAFVDAGYDVKFLIRAIMASETYQRTSTQTDSTQSDPRLFAKMPLRALSAEQLFDSLATAVGFRDPIPRGQSAILFGQNSPRSDFLTKFNATTKPTEAQTSILQALLLMNGKFISDATSVDKSEIFAAICESPFLNTSGKIESLYLTTLSRKPAKDELTNLVKYVEDGDQSKQKQRLADVFWALLNSVEFKVNH